MKPFVAALGLAAAIPLAASAHADGDTMVAIAYSPSTLKEAWVTRINTTQASVETHAMDLCNRDAPPTTDCVSAGSTTGCMTVENINNQWFVGYGTDRDEAVRSVEQNAVTAFGGTHGSFAGPRDPAHCSWDRT